MVLDNTILIHETEIAFHSIKFSENTTSDKNQISLSDYLLWLKLNFQKRKVVREYTSVGHQ